MTTLPPPHRFCDSACRQGFHALADRDAQDLHPKPGRCWLCRCALPDEAPEERFFLAHASASPSYHAYTSYTVITVGDIQVIAVESDDLDEVMDRYFAGMHLAAREPFADIGAAYDAAVADLRRRGYRRPAPAAPIVDLFLAQGVLVQAHAPAHPTPLLAALIQSAAITDVVWSVRTDARHVREIDRLLRGMGVRSAALLGAKLWVELGLPLPATRR